MKKFLSLTTLFTFIICCSLHAGTYWWKPQLMSTSFNTASNWVTGLTCGTTVALSVPGSGDDINFTSCGNSNCTIDASIVVNTINMVAGYTATISISSGKTFHL